MAAGYSERMSPDMASLVFPDRPIRPLPRRRLRERLSADVADAIEYPPAPQATAPLFYYPFGFKEDSLVAGEVSNVVNRENLAELVQESGVRRNGLVGDLGDDEGLMAQARRALGSRSLQETSGNVFLRTPPRQSQSRHTIPQPPPSTASSADGYDSFENTNNKKKRKIPAAGESIMNSAHVLADPSALGVPSPPTTGDEAGGESSGQAVSPYQQAGSTNPNGQGFSGPGRGRYGRVRNGRSPLRALADSNSNWGGRTGKLRPGGGQYPPSPAGTNPGIISSAIKSAEELAAPQGQENISLLHQHASIKSSPPSHFTFTFDSQALGSVSFPGSDLTPSTMAGTSHSKPLAAEDRRETRKAVKSQATQTGHAPPGGTAGGSHEAGLPDEGPKVADSANATPKKSKRRGGNPLQRQEQQRRQQQQLHNHHHPPAPGESYMCMFCEYEMIFGERPEALIRSYEIRERRHLREEAERRRLLEKAKTKSRKGKKTAKTSPKNASPAQDRNAALSADHQDSAVGSNVSQESPSDEFAEGEYEEANVAKEELAAGPSGRRNASAISSSARGAGGGGTGGHGRDSRRARAPQP